MTTHPEITMIISSLLAFVAVRMSFIHDDTA